MKHLKDLIPAKYRRHVYNVGAVGLATYALWEASNGDVRTFVVSLAAASVSALAGGNVNDDA